MSETESSAFTVRPASPLASCAVTTDTPVAQRAIRARKRLGSRTEAEGSGVTRPAT